MLLADCGRRIYQGMLLGIGKKQDKVGTSTWHGHLMQLHRLVTADGSAKSHLIIVSYLEAIVSYSGASRILTLALRSFSTPSGEDSLGA